MQIAIYPQFLIKQVGLNRNSILEWMKVNTHTHTHTHNSYCGYREKFCFKSN